MVLVTKKGDAKGAGWLEHSCGHRVLKSNRAGLSEPRFQGKSGGKWAVTW